MSIPPNPAEEPPQGQPEPPAAPSLAASLTNATVSGDPALQQLAVHRMRAIAAPDGVPTLAGTPLWWRRILGRADPELHAPTQQRPPVRYVLVALFGGTTIVVVAFALTLIHFQGGGHQGNTNAPSQAGTAATHTPSASATLPPTKTPLATTPSPMQQPTNVPAKNPQPTTIPPTATPDTCTLWSNGPDSNGNTIDNKNSNYNESDVLQGLYNTVTGTFCGQFRTAARWWVPTSAFSQGTLTTQTLTYGGPGQIATNQSDDPFPFNEPANYLSPWMYGKAVPGTCARGISMVKSPAYPSVQALVPWSNAHQDANGNDIWCP